MENVELVEAFENLYLDDENTCNAVACGLVLFLLFPG